jgi:C-terminal processing protease CtpA/Prc
MNFKISFIVLAACIFSSCEKLLFEENTSNEPIKNFEVLWKEFDLNYSYFEYKKVNWDSIYNVYRPLVSDNTSDKELFNILWQMTNHLKDGHVNIYSPFGCSYYNFHNSSAPTANIISDSELIKYFDNLNYPNQVFRYSKIKSKNIGYVKITSFANPLSEYQYIDNIIKEFETTDGIIIDLRNNGGGSTNNSDVILSRFMDEKRLYCKVRHRNGPKHTDFTNWINVYIEPSGNQYLKSIVVLINKGCFSTTEDCTLAFRELPHVRIIGDTTGGGGGNPIARELPNGWIYRLSNWEEVDSKNVNYEGIGIPPDAVVWISKQDSINGIDRILETAINMIDKNK